MSASADNSRWWPAPAKLNLFLHITGRRSDGYHELQTVFQLLDFGDRLAFTLRDDAQIIAGLPGVPDPQNLAVRAALALRERAGVNSGVDIRIDKRIPAGAGLGGGSSDAATTLLALNTLWGLNLSRETLLEIGATLGADVPIFVDGRNSWAEGLGERLTPIELPPRWYVVVAPPVAVATARIYNDPSLTRDCPPITIGGFRAGRVGNVLEPVTRRLYPEFGQVLDWLAGFGEARMTGSGGAVFIETDDRASGERVLADLPARWQGFVAQGVGRHPLSHMAHEGRDVAVGGGSTGV